MVHAYKKDDYKILQGWQKDEITFEIYMEIAQNLWDPKKKSIASHYPMMYCALDLLKRTRLIRLKVETSFQNKKDLIVLR